MRISDWSSDVCSSDLAEIEIGDRQRHPILHPLEVAAQRLRHDDRLLVNLLEHEMAVVALRHEVAGHAGDRDRALDGIVVAIENPRTLARHDHPIAFLEIRSEEHTSELQSLMRLSYAVFCLKNKKPKHTKNRQ